MCCKMRKCRIEWKKAILTRVRMSRYGSSFLSGIININTMASQIAHIIYDNQFFRKLDESGIAGLILPAEKLNREEFILGSIFPDIRRVDRNIKRKDTHMHFTTIDLDFSKLNSFEAGWKFHLYCDMKREEILNRYNFYDLPKTNELYCLPGKMLEDEMVYDTYDNWEKLYNFFNNPPYIKTELGITEDTYDLWYAIIAKYIENAPNDKAIRVFLNKSNNMVDRLDKIISLLVELRKNKKVTEILLKIKDEII